MRIIGGIHKGRKIHPPKGLPVRPTTDFGKEGLFNVLSNRIDLEGISVLDLCSGTGSISFEFASRGAKNIIAIDQNFQCIKHINQTAKDLNLKNLRAIKYELHKFIKQISSEPIYDIVFLDPPYDIEDILNLPQLILEKNVLKEGGFLIVEHDAHTNFSEMTHFSFSKRYGNVNFTFFEAHRK